MGGAAPMTIDEARAIVEALHRAVVSERPYPSREVIVAPDGWVAGHYSARWYSLCGEGATEEEALRDLVARARREAEDVAAGLTRRAKDARRLAREADAWEARAKAIRALLAPRSPQLSLLTQGEG